jgi:3-methyladenine DNA glycosylase AlkD
MGIDVMDELSEKLLTCCDSAYAAFHQKLVPDTRYPVWGVRVPILRKIAREMAKNAQIDDMLALHRIDFSKNLPCYEMVMVHLLTIAYASGNLETLMERVLQSIGLIDCWGLCDSFAATLGKRLAKTAEGHEKIRFLTASSQVWTSRVGLVTALSLNGEFREDYLVFLQQQKLQTEATAVSMGLAWLLSQYLATHQETVLQMLHAWRFDALTLIRTKQKIKESRRYDRAWIRAVLDM